MMFNNLNTKTSKTISISYNFDKKNATRSHSLNNKNNLY